MATGLTAMPNLLPESQGIQFNSRPEIRTKEAIVGRTLSRASRVSSRGLLPGEGGEFVPKAAFPSMSVIEVEGILRQRVKDKFENIQQAFKTYDVDGNGTNSKGEFRRVLESFCMPLSTDQFNSILAKVQKSNRGMTVDYTDFLSKFSSGNIIKRQSIGSGPVPAQEVNLDVIEKLLRDKISGNFRAVVKGLQLFDYNMDGKIQRHELRRVLENYCFKFTDQQFDKLWHRYDFHHTGLVNYRDFLKRLGVSVKNANTAPPSNCAAGALQWPKVSNMAAHNKNNKLRKEQKEDEKLLKTLTFDQIEIEFRNRMRANYVKLKKAFMSFDRHLDGYVSIEDLQSILSSFTMPLTNQLFQQLMERCGVKASGRVKWEIFLENFQNPISYGNGQTLPIRSNHRIHPIMETQSVVDWDAIWQQLYKRVQSHYNGLKEAFLQMDKNRDGRVTRREFRDLIEKFTFRLNDKQFKELMSRIDPDHNPRVDYHTFLRLFEETETKEGHKWLKSVHRYNDKQKSAILAWETIEELLREKIMYYWKDVSDWLKYHDKSGSGYISKSVLKKIIDSQVLPISDEHFKSLLSKCQDFNEGKVNYIEFLDRLGVDPRPGDIVGLSTQIMHGSSQAEVKRYNDLIDRQNQQVMFQCHRTSRMTADEVISRFKDKISQWSPVLRKAFLTYDKQSKGRITKKQFREILSDLGIIMSDEQFGELMAKLNMANGHMQYMDFIMNFGDPREGGASQGVVEHMQNHRVNEIRGDETGMTASQAQLKLRQKLRENFTNLRGAFYKFDENHQGCLDRSSFRRVLDSFMINVSDDEFSKLCLSLGLNKGSKVSYQDFLDKFEVRDTAEGHKWLNSVHKYNDTNDPRPFTASEAHNILVKKAHRQWKDLSLAFRTMDRKGKGVIKKQDLRNILEKFLIPIESNEFKILWERYDPSGKGYITHDDFTRQIGASEYAPGDGEGHSQSIIHGNRMFLSDHNQLQQERHEQITLNQANLTQNMPAIIVQRQLRDKIRDSYLDFYSAFKKYDTSKTGALSADDIQKVLVEQNFFINDEQFFVLLDRIGLPTDRSRINYKQFLEAFEDGRKSSYGRRPKDIRIQEFGTLKPEQAENKLREKLFENIDDVYKAFSAFDKDQCGKIPLSEFHRVLDLFCFILTDPQWQHVKSKLTLGADRCVDYNEFVSNFTDSQYNDERYLREIQDGLPAAASQLLTVDEIGERIHEAVVNHYHKILRDLESLDYAKLGSLSVEDFKDVVTRHIMRLDDSQFEKVLQACPVNEFGNVDYKAFLKMFSEDVPSLENYLPSNSATNKVSKQNELPIRPATSLSRSSSRLSSRTLSRLSRSTSKLGQRAPTPMVNAEGAENSVKSVVLKYWKEWQKQCRDLDVDNTGTISIKQFKDLLTQYDCLLTGSEFTDLVTKYDLQENNRFNYSEFLKYFVLNRKPTEKTGREKVALPLLSNSIKNLQGSDAVARTKECVTQHWKEMRREFRSLDAENLSFVTVDEFRQVLRLFGANLSENEFQNLQDKYDRNFTDSVNYDKFLKDHLN